MSIPQARVQQFQNYQRPCTKKQLQSFLGLCNYFRKCVPSFSNYSVSLTPAVTKTSPTVVVWSTTMTNAFHDIIAAIVDHTKLCILVFTDVYVLCCDASSYGVGGVLCVCRSGNELPVGYYSRQLLDRETRYSATELECLAVLNSIKHFSYYLYGRHFVVKTDHKALTSLFSSSTLHNCLWRWRIQLLDYDFDISYRPGVENSIPDALSRQGWLISETSS